MNLIFIRHGQTHWNSLRKTQGRTDIPLDETGLCQARLVASRLKRRPVTAVLTSPLMRARQTAECIATPHGLAPIEYPLLIEQDFGDWEGIPIDQLTDSFPAQLSDWWKDPFSSIPQGGESMQAVKDRLLPLLNDLTSSYQQKDTIAIVGHSVPLRLLIAHLLGLAESRLHHFRLDNASITEFQITGERTIMLVCNDTAHLEGEAMGVVHE
ncbi:histidine phosphatase family protein [Christensenellaceae bacterium OttesenSCG-928-M15]|nr:histidine phosphatase family protein [Christensenellaceae bacterium OttesenSCG-928-M15]